ncbi:MAG: lipoyl(octanoyl) transferase LipB [Saprospiraceae bacterium]
MLEPSLQTVHFRDLGHMPYVEAWDYQTKVHETLKAIKKAHGWEKAPVAPTHQLIFVEHNPVYTLGKSGSIDHLLLDEEGLKAKGVEFHKINRGGDITFHGPGQIVGYPIFDLDWFFHDVRKYVWSLEEGVIRTLAGYGVAAERYEGYTGVWLPPTEVLPWRKICAIGVHVSRWVTLHGFAFNVNTDLSYFRGIVPCGIASGAHEVTSLSVELGRSIDLEEAKSSLRQNLASIFGFEYN